MNRTNAFEIIVAKFRIPSSTRKETSTYDILIRAAFFDFFEGGQNADGVLGLDGPPVLAPPGTEISPGIETGEDPVSSSSSLMNRFLVPPSLSRVG